MLGYCIECEQVVNMNGKHSEIHFIPKGVFDWDVCMGPFAVSTPPVMDNNYWKWLFDHEPSQDELETLMDF